MINTLSNVILFNEGAQSGGTPANTGLFGNNIWQTVLMFGLLIAVVVVFYFVVLRPNKKQQQKEEQMKASLKVGDYITTIGGIVGMVVAIKGDFFTIVTSKERTRLTFTRSALKSIDKAEPAPNAKPEETKAEAAEEDKTESAK